MSTEKWFFKRSSVSFTVCRAKTRRRQYLAISYVGGLIALTIRSFDLRIFGGSFCVFSYKLQNNQYVCLTNSQLLMNSKCTMHCILYFIIQIKHFIYRLKSFDEILRIPSSVAVSLIRFIEMYKVLQLIKKKIYYVLWYYIYSSATLNYQ